MCAGEQLLVRPSGYGECGCIQHPVHVAMEQHGGLCYPLYNQVHTPGYQDTMHSGIIQQTEHCYDNTMLGPMCGGLHRDLE